jgi:hypothetical protein
VPAFPQPCRSCLPHHLAALNDPYGSGTRGLVGVRRRSVRIVFKHTGRSARAVALKHEQPARRRRAATVPARSEKVLSSWTN